MRVRSFLVGITFLVFSVSRALGDSIDTEIDYQAGASANAEGILNVAQSVGTSLFGAGNPIVVGNNFEVTNNDAGPFYARSDDATVGYFGRATIGSLGAGVGGQASAQTTGPYLTFSSAFATATVKSSYLDLVEINYPEFPVDKKFLVNGKFTLHGSVTGSVDGSVLANNHFGSWSAGATLVGLDSGDVANGAEGTTLQIEQTGAIGQGGVDQTTDQIIPISVLLENGEYDGLGETLSVGGTASVRTSFVDAATVTAQFTADFKDTLGWDGITSVVDPDDGLPITGWTITSASGFDYTQPAPVPEPSTFTILLIGTILTRTTSTRNQRRRGSGRRE